MRFWTWAALAGSLPAFADVSLAPDRVAHFLVHTVTKAGELRTGILAVDLSARRLIWSRETRDTFEVRVPRLGGLLFFPHSRDGRLECLESYSGRVVWEAAPGPFRVVLPLSTDQLVTGGRSTEVTCWRIPSPAGGSLERLWSVGLEADEARDLVAAPGGRILIPTYRSLYCVRASDGTVLWRHNPPVAACTYAVAAGRDRVVSWDWWGARLETLSLETGQVAWRETMAAPWVFGVLGGLILARSGPTGRVQGLRAETGIEQWGLEDLAPQAVLPGSSDDLAYMPFAGPAAHPDGVWILTRDRREAVCLEPSTGAIRARRTFDQPLVGVASAGRYICFAEPARLLFFGQGGVWQLDLPRHIHHLRQLARP